MPEMGNVEVAKTLHETAEGDERQKRRSERILEIATAWSGYQSARWDGRQALQYGEASRMRQARSWESIPL